jgi:hypothetical protein
MALPSEAELLRIYIGSQDGGYDQPLYKVIVEKAYRRGLAGATVLQGREGFGANKHVHMNGACHMCENVPVVIEIVDRPELIAEFLPELEGMIGEGMATVEPVRAVFYRYPPKPAGGENKK